MINKEFRRLFRHPLFWLVTFARCGGAFIIVLNPLWGYIVYVILDILDGQILPNFAGMSPLVYHIWDKYVDLFVFIVMLFSSVSYGVFNVLLILLLYRMVGQIIFWKTKSKKYLIFFPNIFEAVWLWFVVGKQLGIIDGLNASGRIYGLTIVVFLKLLHEFYCHLIGPKIIIPVWRKYVDKIFPGYYKHYD